MARFEDYNSNAADTDAKPSLMTSWNYTDGAPFICATPSVKKLWRGIQGSSIGGSESDYERVCEVAGYLGLIACGHSQVLVLGDEPAQAAFFATPNEPIIARWIACGSVDLADSVLAKVPDTLPHLQPAVRFHVGESELQMFDASIDGAMNTAKDVALSLTPGVFDVTTERYQQGRVFEFCIHRFVRTLP